MTLITILLAAIAVVLLLCWHQTIREWGRTIEKWTATLDELEQVEMENDDLRAELAAKEA